MSTLDKAAVFATGLGLCFVSFSDRTEAYFKGTFLGMEPSANYGSHVRPVGVPTLNVQEIVELLKGNGFPTVAIAEMARVERKTIYSWVDGAQARPQHEERMRTLFQVLKDATGGDYRYVHRVWKAKGADGLTLRDYLVAESLDIVAIAKRIESLKESMAYYAKVDARRGPALGSGRGNPIVDDSPVADLG